MIAAGSLWHIQWWEALCVPLSLVVGLLLIEVFSDRARTNRKLRRRARRSERQLVRRQRAW